MVKLIVVNAPIEYKGFKKGAGAFFPGHRSRRRGGTVALISREHRCCFVCQSVAFPFMQAAIILR